MLSLSQNFPSIQNSGNFSAGRLSLSAGGSDIGSVLQGLGGGGVEDTMFLRRKAIERLALLFS
jgi:hypothetical protein